MTKSRIALTLIAAAWSAAASADPPVVTAEEALAAWDAEFDAVMARARGLRRCPRQSDEEDIVVCGRADDQNVRVPYAPVPGAVHHIAGDLPTGREAMAAGGCLRLCPQPVMVDVIAAARALARGVDRILHPD
ncbi:MAG TPA: hypothetical protein VGW40_03995 [Allosphingosinicella sp.]|nr:hypothetical protein [Allosphingosinicella sp.]